MGKKRILGIDIGYNSLKMALVENGKILNLVTVQTPEQLIKDGRVVSTETIGELVRNTMKEHGIKCRYAALMLSNESVFIRNVTLPVMTEEQLMVNLPYEFRDYISDELKNYRFDYAMISTPEELKDVQEEEPTKEQAESEPMEAIVDDTQSSHRKNMELTAVAVSEELLQDMERMFRKAGLRLRKAAPAISAYASLIRKMEEEQGLPKKEYCILDLGHRAVRMYVFSGDCHVATRELEVGLSNVDAVIADEYHVDIHMAHTYLINNYDDCQTKGFCQTAFSNISVELMRALNFFRFSNPDSQLQDVWICGGGAEIKLLAETIKQMLDMNIHTAKELIGADLSAEESNLMIQAIGIALED